METQPICDELDARDLAISARIDALGLVDFRLSRILSKGEKPDPRGYRKYHPGEYDKVQSQMEFTLARLEANPWVLSKLQANGNFPCWQADGELTVIECTPSHMMLVKETVKPQKQSGLRGFFARLFS